MNIKPQDAIAKKWAARAGAAQADYTSGVQSTQKSWATNTANAAQNWADGVSAAVADGRFAKGVNNAGDAAWKAGAVNKGSQRYSQGVQGATTKYTQGFSASYQALAAATLPAKFPRGNPNNTQRVTFVNTLLRNVKLGKA